RSELEQLTTAHAEAHQTVLARINEEAAERQSDAWNLGKQLEEMGQQLRNEIQVIQTQLTLNRERVMTLLEQLEKLSHSAVPTILRDEKASLLDEFFARFDERFRGDRTEIKERLKSYLPSIASIDGDRQKVVDLGCGRGEWLELVR